MHIGRNKKTWESSVVCTGFWAERVGVRLFDRLACRTMLGMRADMGLSLGVVSGGDDRAGCRSLLAERAGRRLFVVRAGSRELGKCAPRKLATRRAHRKLLQPPLLQKRIGQASANHCSIIALSKYSISKAPLPIAIAVIWDFTLSNH